MKASVFIGTSLDGFIARANGDLDFLPPGGGEPHGYDEFMATVDALVIGRKTFETVLTFEAWPYGEKPVFVLSTRPLASAPAGAVVERMSGDPAEIVSQLAARGIRHIYVDGGITIQRFLRPGSFSALLSLAFRSSSVPGFRCLAPYLATSSSSTSGRGSTPAVSFRVSMRLPSNRDSIRRRGTRATRHASRRYSVIARPRLGLHHGLPGDVARVLQLVQPPLRWFQLVTPRLTISK